MLTLCRYSVTILLLLGLSRGVGGQASPANPVELGDITEETQVQFLAGEVAAVGDTVSYAFTLSAPRRVALVIRQQDTNADLVVVDASETEVGRSATAGTANERVRLALGPGSYRAHVVAQAAGVNAYRLRYRVKAVEDDYGADVDTSGTVLVGESTTGAVDYVGDEDWFFIDLEAARIYTLSVTGTASVPVMVGVYAATGTEVVAGVSGLESAVATFTPDTTALYYIAVAATDVETGSYTLTVTDSTPAPAAEPAPEATSIEQPAPQTPVVAEQQQQEPDYAADRLYALGIDIHDNFTRAFIFYDSVDGDEDPRDYFSFWLDGSTEVNLSLRQLDFDADLFLEDAHGNVLASSENSGTANENIVATLPDDGNTYYIRVEAQETGLNSYRLRAKVADPDPATAVTVPEVTPPPTITYVPPPESAPATEADVIGTRSVSEPEGQDVPATAATTASVDVGGRATGELDSGTDTDGFKVDLVAGKRYRIDVWVNTSFDFGNGGTYEGKPTLDIFDGDASETDPDDVFRLNGYGETLSSRPGGEVSYEIRNKAGGPAKGARSEFDVLVTDTYLIRVTADGNTGTYTVLVSDITSEQAYGDFTSGQNSGRLRIDDTNAMTGTRGVGDFDWYLMLLEEETCYAIHAKGAHADTNHRGGTLNDPELKLMKMYDYYEGQYYDENGIYKEPDYTEDFIETAYIDPLNFEEISNTDDQACATTTPTDADSSRMICSYYCDDNGGEGNNAKIEVEVKTGGGGDYLIGMSAADGSVGTYSLFVEEITCPSE